MAFFIVSQSEKSDTNAHTHTERTQSALPNGIITHLFTMTTNDRQLVAELDYTILPISFNTRNESVRQVWITLESALGIWMYGVSDGLFFCFHGLPFPISQFVWFSVVCADNPNVSHKFGDRIIVHFLSVLSQILSLPFHFICQFEARAELNRPNGQMCSFFFSTLHPFHIKRFNWKCAICNERQPSWKLHSIRSTASFSIFIECSSFSINLFKNRPFKQTSH